MTQKSYYEQKGTVKEFFSVTYLIVLATLVLAKFLSSEILTLAIFIMLFAIFAIKKYDSRVPIAFALFLLVLSAIELSYANEDSANQIAIYAYYYLVAGVLLQLVDYVRGENEAEN